MDFDNLTDEQLLDFGEWLGKAERYCKWQASIGEYDGGKGWLKDAAKVREIINNLERTQKDRAGGDPK